MARHIIENTDVVRTDNLGLEGFINVNLAAVDEVKGITRDKSM
jgi:hypothetical protein